MLSAADVAAVTNFNPRLREGGDRLTWLVFTFHSISIHASAREAT